MKKITLVLIAASIVVAMALYNGDFFSKQIAPEPISKAVYTNDGVLQATNAVQWPVSGSAPQEDVLHTVPLNEIKQGCMRQDCIPSVDDPVFVTSTELKDVLDPVSIGIALSYKGENRFYPFPMLETHELVNDVVAGDPLLISYCPLCGTGIVFERTLDGQPVAFGVSGMLWQSNLLMYNRADALTDRNLWSQVLGKAVVGDRAGQQLVQVPSDIVQFGAWARSNPDGKVLTTGVVRDPYEGAYYQVARSFSPSFDEDTSALEPMAYVYGIEIAGAFKAYPADLLTQDIHTDIHNGVTLTIVQKDNTVVFKDAAGVILDDVEGFWFSWKAAHPDTAVWSNS
mgnify:CR=1 FL=1